MRCSKPAFIYPLSNFQVGWAFNHIEKKKGLYKPKHSIEEQLAYMKSKGKF